MNDSGVETEPVALILHRLTPTGDSVAERRRLARHRTGDVAPVVQHVRKVDDPSAATGDQLGRPQDQVVIL